MFIAPDSNEKWLWVQLFQLFATKTVIINFDRSFGVRTGRKFDVVCASGNFLS
jgi:hypothetical protein